VSYDAWITALVGLLVIAAGTMVMSAGLEETSGVDWRLIRWGRFLVVAGAVLGAFAFLL
jgi:hypothetical protein